MKLALGEYRKFNNERKMSELSNPKYEAKWSVEELPKKYEPMWLKEAIKTPWTHIEEQEI